MNPVGSRQRDDSGFTLLEVMIATLVLTIGLLSVAYGVGVGLGVVQTSNEETVAREKAREAMEDVFTARDTGGITFTQICNVAPGTPCIFINGFEPMYTPGPDGIVNTADDGTETPLPPGCGAAPCIETLDTPGPDGILGTADDVYVPLLNFSRQIQVSVVPGQPNLLQITVTISYTTKTGLPGPPVVVTAFISAYV